MSLPAASADLLPAQFVKAFAALDLAESPAEAGDVQAMFESLRVLAKKAGLSLEVQNRAAEGKLRAERRAGELLGEVVSRGGDPKSHDVTLAGLGLSKHQSSRWQRIAAIPDAEFEAYVAAAYNEARELTTAGALQLARTLSASRPADKPPLHVVPDPDAGLPGLGGAKFTTIVSDPPWQYDNRGTRNAARKHYETMTVDDVCDLPVEANAADNAHLYLWTTNAFLRDAFTVMEAWGFTYKAHLVWVKPQMGMGNYFRISHEHVLFGVRGSLPTQTKNTMSWFEANRGRHSAKPQAFYELVEHSSPGPYLDMFSRARRLGWSGWGEEA